MREAGRTASPHLRLSQGEGSLDTLGLRPCFCHSSSSSPSSFYLRLLKGHSISLCLTNLLRLSYNGSFKRVVILYAYRVGLEIFACREE